MSRIRSSAIIIHNNQICLIHRKKDGREYWVFPGGGVDEGETAEQAVIRETDEETGLKCKEVKYVFDYVHPDFGVKHPYFLCDVEYSDKLSFSGGPEAAKHSEHDWYHPEWVDLDKVSDLNLYPEEIKEKVIELDL